MQAKKELYVCISLDVEEEGLFSGSYPRLNCRVSNVSRLPRLAPLSHELGLPLTLLCTHSVFSDASARKTLEFMRDQCGAEIGAHLHHWSTPPFSMSEKDEKRSPQRTGQMERDLLASRLESLLKAGQDFQGAPLESFRMGRWDLLSSWRPMLAEYGILTDSSICPLRHFANGPNHFSAPADPYWVRGNDRPLLEAPITQIPLNTALANLWGITTGKNTAWRDSFHYFGAISANPYWHGANIMKLTAKLHAHRGGRVLSLFWHSSEMLPGASPHVPDQTAADAYLEKIMSFCRWLNDKFIVKGISLKQLYQIAPELNFRDYAKCIPNEDW